MINDAALTPFAQDRYSIYIVYDYTKISLGKSISIPHTNLFLSKILYKMSDFGFYQRYFYFTNSDAAISFKEQNVRKLLP